MRVATIRKKLHEYIEHADAKKVKALFTILESNMEEDFELSDADMKELDGRWKDYLSGKTKSYTLEEAKNKLNEYRAGKEK